MLAAHLEDATDQPDNNIATNILRLPLSGIMPATYATGPAILDLIHPDFSDHIAVSNGAKINLAAPEEAKLFKLIQSTDTSHIRIKPEFETGQPTSKKGARAVYSRIENLCNQIQLQQASVTTSAVKPQRQTAPGTPLSEAWETQSGPLANATPKHTPIRKIILKLTPKMAEPSTGKSTIKKNEQHKTKMTRADATPVLVKTFELDIDHKIAKLENDLSSGVAEADIVDHLKRMRSEFSQDTVAVKEWILGRVCEIVESSHAPTIKDHIIGLVFTHLSSINNWSTYGKIIELAFTYLVERILPLTEYASSISNLILRIPLDDSLSMKLATALRKALCSPHKLSVIRIISVLSSCCPEVKDFFFSELLANSEYDNEPFGLVLSGIVQSCLIREMEVTEAGVKRSLAPLTEELCKRFSSSPSQAATSLARIIQAMPDCLCIPELPVSIFLAKFMANFAVSVFTSEKFKLDPMSRLLIIDALIALCSFIRSNERLGMPSSFCMDYFYQIDLPLSERNNVMKIYITIVNMAKPSDEAVPGNFISLHKRLISCTYLAPLANQLILILVRLMSDANLQVRIKSLRGLATILTVDDEFVKKEGFLGFLSSKFDDPSVTIRDVSLEMLTKCFSNDRLIELNILEGAIARRIHDSSPIIKKRVIRIYRDVLSCSISADLHAILISGLLMAVKDEDTSVSLIALKVLKERWLSKVIEKIQDRQEIVNFAALIIRTMRLLKTEPDCIQVFLKSCLEEKGMLDSTKALCAATVDILFESLIGSVENSNWEAVKFILNAIDIFVGEQHDYLSCHLRLLFELTKSTEMLSIECALKLMRTALAGIDQASLLQLSGCEQHLNKLILTGSEPVVKNAIDFLCAYMLAINDTSGYLTTLWGRYDSFLELKKSDQNLKEFLSPICRAILSLGYLMKSLFKISSESIGIPLEKAISIFCFYYDSPNQTISFYALQSIGFLVAENPSLALRSDVSQLVKKAFGQNRADLVLVLLRSLIVMIEKKGDTSPALISFDTSMKPSECNVTATIIQAYINEIVEASYATDKECQLLALKILSYALMSGLCHPHQVIPSVVALTSSPIEDVSLRAKHVFESLVETHSSFLFSNYTNMIHSIFRLHSKFTQDEQPSGYYGEAYGFESLLGPLYSHLRTKKAKRHDLISVLFQEFDDAFGQDKIVYAKFVLELISMLPLRTQEEVSFVLVRVNELALGCSASYLEGEGDREYRLYTKCVLLLILRKYLAFAYSLTLDRCEKALEQDGIGKVQAVNKAAEPISFDFEDRMDEEERLEHIKALLDDQRWIEHSEGDKANEKNKAASKPGKNRSRKRRRKSIDASSEDDSDFYY